MHGNVLNRKLHYWGAAVIAVPFLMVVGTGILLQLKKQWTWVQPAEQRGTGTAPRIELSTILDAVKADPALGVSSWADVRRLDVRPDRGVVKVWLVSNWEAQVDLGTGRILQTAYRRSDLIESFHDGSFFGDLVKLGVFLPAGCIVLGLWMTGMWMWLWPVLNRRRVRMRKRTRRAA
jgi:hypothetical protein